MVGLETCGYTGTWIPAGVEDVLVRVMFSIVKKGFNSRLDEAPRPSIQRLLLRPDDIFRIRVHVQIFAQLLPREWIQLLNTGYSSALDAFFLAVLLKRNVSLARAHNDALDFFWGCDSRSGVCGVGNDPLEMRVAGEVFDARAGEGMAEESFGEEDGECWAQVLAYGYEITVSIEAYVS